MIQSCSSEDVQRPLPILGPKYTEDRVEDGQMRSDTFYYPVRSFSFTNQDGESVTEHNVKGKVYVVDFFFTSCPTICPKMKQQMLRVYSAFEDESNLILLSHSIDPERDSVGRLREFAKKLGVEAPRWNFLTGERDSIYSMAEHYVLAAMEDKDAPGGFAHSGAFLLMDQQRFIRGIYDGTNAAEVDDLMGDIRWLLKQP